MKIDVHTHTIKTKSGDSEKRNITVDKFSSIIKSTEVKIFAITNHNHFDLVQYSQFSEALNGICQIWPGVELDIVAEDRRAHMIVIVNPKHSSDFSEKLESLLESSTPDSFTVSINKVVECFDGLDPIYISHYHSKKPNLLDKDIELLAGLVKNKRRILKEASNSISAGIYISHGHNSIHGSDIQDWDNYKTVSQDLPDLRLPVESYEQFCLLLEKDIATINTILDKKTKETISITPFGVAELIELDIYNDINIVFGSKGTGKSEILKALQKYYNDKGHKTNVYTSSNLNLEEVYDIKEDKFSTKLINHEIDECFDEIKFIKAATEQNITSISAYSRYFSAEETNRISKNIAVKNFNPLDDSASKRSLDEIKNSLSKIKDFKKYIESDTSLPNLIQKELIDELNVVIDKILLTLNSESETRILTYRSIVLFNNLIKKFVSEIAKKTGLPEKPISTGFHSYISNRIKIERNIKSILQNISKPIQPNIEIVGDLGLKGQLHCQTNLVIQNGKHSNSTFRSISRASKTPQKLFSAQLELIFKHIYSNLLFEKISELNAIENSEDINGISDLLLFNRHFSLNGQIYKPSNGESSMLLLHQELLEDKEIYILDEPEKSLGNDYISEIIVPLLKKHANLGRKVIIATHDANIAVRTLPYNSIFRMHDMNKYYTFTGNPFSNKLICINKTKDDIDWKEISMKTLEGGRDAFGERGKIYGNA